MATSVRIRSLLPKAQSVKDEIHGPDFVWLNILMAIVAQLFLYPPSRIHIANPRG